MCTKLSGERNKGAREQYNISSPAGGIAAQAKPAIFYVCSIANSPVPTNITSYVLPPGVFICGSTAICVNRYLQKRKGIFAFPSSVFHSFSWRKISIVLETYCVLTRVKIGSPKYGGTFSSISE